MISTPKFVNGGSLFEEEEEEDKKEREELENIKAMSHILAVAEL